MTDNQSIGQGAKKYLAGAGLFILEFLKIAILAGLTIALVRYYLFKPFYVKGASMEPTFYDHEYLIIDEITYRLNEPKRGDVIVFKLPQDTGRSLIKRIIGLPGETVNIKNGSITISKDGKSFILDEKYLPFDLKTYGEVNTVLGSDEFFVLGDNREFSYDSRRWGNVPREDIIGKALLRILPLAALSEFSAPNY